MIENIYNFIKYLRLDLIHYQYCEQSECAVRVGPLKKMTLNILDRELISLDFSNCFLYSYSHSFFQFEAILKCAKHLRTSIKLHRLGWRPFEMEFDSKFSTIFHKFDGKIKAGKHSLLVSVTDGRGNETLFKSTFVKQKSDRFAERSQITSLSARFAVRLIHAFGMNF